MTGKPLALAACEPLGLRVITLVLPVWSSNHSCGSDGDDHKWPTPAMLYKTHKANLTRDLPPRFLNELPYADITDT